MGTVSPLPLSGNRLGFTNYEPKTLTMACGGAIGPKLGKHHPETLSPVAMSPTTKHILSMVELIITVRRTKPLRGRNQGRREAPFFQLIFVQFGVKVLSLLSFGNL